MPDERSRTKSEIKYLFTGLKNKEITDDMMSILIDFLYRDPVNQRSSGFEFACNYDSEISFDTGTRIFTIKPFDPLVEGSHPFNAYSKHFQLKFQTRKVFIVFISTRNRTRGETKFLPFPKIQPPKNFVLSTQPKFLFHSYIGIPVTRK
jgi:hypothetical protein